MSAIEADIVAQGSQSGEALFLVVSSRSCVDFDRYPAIRLLCGVSGIYTWKCFAAQGRLSILAGKDRGKAASDL